MDKRAARVAARAPDFDIDVDATDFAIPDAGPTAPNAPPPLEAAYRARAVAVARRDLNAEHAALLQENVHLKAKLNEVHRFQGSPNILIYDKAKEERCDAIACAMASDWHVEEVVNPDAVHGLNSYSPEIARARAQLFFQNLLRLTDIVARDSIINTILLQFAGDFISGYIHEELMASTAMGPGDAAAFAKELLCSGIDFLLKESSYIITGDMIPGNHGRLTKQVWVSDPTGTSIESFMYGSIAERYAGNPRVKLNVSSHAMVYRQLFPKFLLRTIHGYEVKYGGGVGGITIPVRKAIAQWDMGKQAQLTLFGHFHQRIDGGNFLGNGSLIGYNTYAQFIKAAHEEAAQAFFMVHARGGGTKSVVAPIWVNP